MKPHTHLPLLLVLLVAFFSAQVMAETKKEFYDTGELKTEKVYVDGKLKTEKRYRLDGKLEYEMQMEDKRKIEIEYEYYATGELFRERPRINGQMQGWEKDYYPSGQLKAQRMYRGGKKNGKAQGFYENGQVQGDWVFEDGIPVDATIYHPNGAKYLEHEFSDGRLNGWTNEYDIKGKLIAKRLYENDKLIKRERE
jgi:antitoxin component YwqK of YwqJK toxin-antitoxin module